WRNRGPRGQGVWRICTHAPLTPRLHERRPHPGVSVCCPAVHTPYTGGRTGERSIAMSGITAALAAGAIVALGTATAQARAADTDYSQVARNIIPSGQQGSVP